MIDLQVLRERAWLNAHIREFFSQRNVWEVETALLSQAGNTDPQIDSYSVNTEPGMRYLHTSPEYPMKRLLAQGSGDIYQICKVWRQGESGKNHNPEFTLLEYYRVGFSYQQLMQEVTTLLQPVLKLTKAACHLSYRDCFIERLGLDPHQTDVITPASLNTLAARQGVDIQGTLDTQGWLDLLFTHCVAPHFPADRLTYVYDYPASQAALAQITQNALGQTVAQRFEVYKGALELGNGYQELTTPEHNQEKLQQDAQQRAHHKQSSPPLDQHFLSDLRTHKLPHCAGIALGLDRILMARLKSQHLAQVLAFPWQIA